MSILLVGIAILVVGGAAALCARGSERFSGALGAGSAVAGPAVAFLPVVPVLLGQPAASFRMPWSVPYGEFFLEIDALSAFFLVPILLLSALAALSGSEAVRSDRERRHPGAHWFFYNLLVASMVLVVLARNGVLFLAAWETMSLASFFLVTHEDESAAVREAGWTYLVATHLGTAFLLALFLLLGKEAGGSLSFDRFAALPLSPATAWTVFGLAVAGFGTKAGFIPLHVWLPEAHPAAPSHVSALMSGVMIKTGIYGLVRAITFLPAPPLAFGWVLVGIGVVSGILGVLFALAQHDVKRLLAYHSVENIGIIALGLGVGMVGLASGAPALAVLGFAGALLHVLNHALFKGLLFLGAGAVVHAAGTREMDLLGGLLKRMPWTAAAFAVGSAAIAGLPPLNGFVSEFLIFRGALDGVLLPGAAPAVPSVVTIAALALIGGLAAACFAKVFGLVFLGEPRSAHTDRAHDPGFRTRLATALLAAGCVLIGLFPDRIAAALGPALAIATRLPAAQMNAALSAVSAYLRPVAAVAAGFWGVVALLAVARRRLLSGRPVAASGTWDCGYAAPGPRMQYTTSSFAQPFTALFRGILRTRRTGPAAAGPDAEPEPLSTETPDLFRESVYRPAFEGLDRALAPLRRLQHGRVQLYVLYIVATIVFLLLWRTG